MSVLTIRIPRELKSPNRWQGRHWRYKHRETQEWEQAVWGWIAEAAGAKTLTQVLVAMNAIGPKRVCDERRTVTVTRCVPSARNFIRDDDNLRFSTKPLNDALKRLGLIRDDNRKWLEQPMPEQMVSTHGSWMTVIQIESAPSVDAVDPQATSTGKRSTRAKSSVFSNNLPPEGVR